MQINARPDVTQRRLARRLGIEIPEDTTWGELELLIIKTDPEQIKRNKPGQEQINLARKLGIEVAEGQYTSRYLSALIDVEIARQTGNVLRQNPNIAKGNYISYEGEVYRIAEVQPRSDVYRVRLVGQSGRQRVVPIVLLAGVALTTGV